jgi:transposase, IS6 family
MARRHQAGAVKQGSSFKGRQFTAEVILWAVRWYLMFPISYRDLELMLADRGVEVRGGWPNSDRAISGESA